MKLFSFTKMMMLFSALSLVQGAYAFSDSEAQAEGMIPVEEYILLEMNAATTPGLNSAGVAQAVRNHRMVIAINKATKGPDAQTMTMYENGSVILREKISTGREKEEKAKSGRVYVSTTPKGFFRPTKIYKDYLSYTWNAPMPNAVFFIGGIAIHATGTSSYAQLGTRASGGCIRTKLETSQFVRTKVMDTGTGSRPGQFEIEKEAEGRNRIRKNSVSVDKLDRYSGDMLNEQVISWDTVIIVYEE